MRRLAFFLLGALALAAAALAQSGSASSSASLSPAGTVILYTTRGASLTTAAGTWTFGEAELIGNAVLVLNGTGTSISGSLLALDASGNTWALSGDNQTWYEWISAGAAAPSAAAAAAQAALAQSSSSSSASSSSSSSSSSLSPDGALIVDTTSGASLVTDAGTWTFGALEPDGEPDVLLNGAASGAWGPIIALDANGEVWTLGFGGASWYEWNGLSWTVGAWGNATTLAPGASAAAAQATFLSTGIVLSWTAPAHNVDGSWVYPGEISGYDILYSTDASAFADDSEDTYPITNLVVPAGASDTFIAGLTAGTTYYFEIAALAVDGTMSAYSTAVSGVAAVVALPAPPGAPTIGGGVPLTLAQR